MENLPGTAPDYRFGTRAERPSALNGDAYLAALDEWTRPRRLVTNCSCSSEGRAVDWYGGYANIKIKREDLPRGRERRKENALG